MTTRIGALTAATALAVATGCSSPPPALGTHLIQIPVNGDDAGNFLVECHQTGWIWEIRTLEETPGVIAHVNTEGAPVTARGVQIDNVGGFSPAAIGKAPPGTSKPT